MTTGPSSKRHVTQERCLRDPLQVGDIVILNDSTENWAVIGFSFDSNITHTMTATLEMSSDLRLGVVVLMSLLTVNHGNNNKEEEETK